MRGNYAVMFISVLLLSCSVNTTKIKPESRSVSIVSDSVKIYADISLLPYKKELKNNLQYHWYTTDYFGVNYGGFNGYLLSGNYKKVSFNGNLLVQGEFSNGLKDGIWKYWYPNGNLKRVETWSKGVVRSNILEYNNEGVIIGTPTNTSIETDKSQADSSTVKVPWYKRIFKKGNKSSK